MASIVDEIPELDESVQRPIEFQILRELAELTGMPKDVNIQNSPEETENLQPGGQMGGITSFGGNITYPSVPKFTVSSREEFEGDFTLVNPVRRGNRPPIFADRALHTALYTSYQRVSTTFTIEVRFADRNAAMRWYNTFQRSLSQRRAQITHTVDYHYPVPKSITETIKKIHELREYRAGYGQVLSDYLKSHSISKVFTTITNQAGKNDTLVVTERAYELIGNFSNIEGTLPIPTPNDPRGMYFAQVDYQVWWEKPISMVFNYPYVIHNQVIDEKFIQIQKGYNLDDVLDSYGSIWVKAGQQFRTFSPMGAKSGTGYIGQPIPEWDTWIPNKYPKDEFMQFRGMIALQEGHDGTEGIMSLQELGIYEITEDMIEFMKDDPNSAVRPLGSPVRVYLYEGYDVLDQTVIEITDDLTVRSKAPLDPRKMYHVVTMFHYDLLYLTADAHARLAKHGEFTQKLLYVYMPSLYGTPDWPELNPDGTLNPADLERAMVAIHNRRKPTTITRQSFEAWLVGAFSVYARNRALGES